MGLLSSRETSLTLALLASVFLATFTSCKKPVNSRATGSLRGVTYIYTIDGSQIRSAINADGSVRFYIEAGGRAETVVPMDDRPDAARFMAIKKSADTWIISWHGVPVGEKRGEDTEICGDRFGYGDICEAIFVQRPAELPDANNFVSIGLLERGRALFQANSPTGKSTSKRATAKDEKPGATQVDISAGAMPQIHQRNTGTCLYNSTTGIIEWYRNLQTRSHQRLSAPDVLARLGAYEQIGESTAIANVNPVLGGVVPDEYLPTQDFYNANSANFSGAYKNATQAAQAVADKRVAIPQITGTILFMRQEPSNGIRNQNFATPEDMAQVREWLVTKRRPVHFFHLYGNTTIWHAVIALGWDDARQLILIKDSLGGSDYLATWRTVAEMQRGGYGAVGTMEAENQGSPSNLPSGDAVRIPNAVDSGNSDAPGSLAGGMRAVLAGNRGSDYLYVFSPQPVTSLQILDGSGQWLPMDMGFPGQPGWPSIGAIWVNPAWRMLVTSFSVRALMGGTWQVVTVPLTDKR